MSETPVFDEVKAEYPDLEIPTCVGLTYEECVEHAKPPVQPTGYPTQYAAARPPEVHEPGCTGKHMHDGTNDCIREASDESKDVQA